MYPPHAGHHNKTLNRWNVTQGDALAVLASLPDESVDCCVTSPPYWGLRDYGHSGQMGLEETPEAYVKAMVDLFREVRRVLKPQGTLWLNLGDSYGKRKQLQGIPWRVALGLQSDGWFLRQDIIWEKPNAIPSSVTDRCTTSHEYLFLLAKSEKYHYDQDAIREPQSAVSIARAQRGDWRSKPGWADAYHGNPPKGLAHQGNRDTSIGRNKRSVWTIATKPYKGAHFAVMPEALVEPCILAGCPAGGLVLDPFTGSGTVGAVALRLGRRFVGAELNPIYAEMARERIRQEDPEGWDHLPLLTQPEPMEAQP